MDKMNKINKKASEKEYSTNYEDQSKSLIEEIVLIIRSNWIALAFALLITLITIIVVPIVYTLKTSTSNGKDTNLAWNVSAITIINQTTLFNGFYTNSLGLISSIIFDSSKTNLYILDQTKHRILKYSIDNNEGLILVAGHLNGTSGDDSTSFNSPNDIFIDINDNIYVADTFNNRIQLWETNSEKGSTICGTGTTFNHPMSLTMDESSLLYIADYGSNQILSCNLTTHQSQIFISYNTNGNRNTYVYTPISIKYDSQSNSLVIAQAFGYNVVRWKLGTNSWTLIAGSARSELSGRSRTLFNQLCNVNIDPFNNTYVVDCFNQRIQFYRGDLTQGRTIAGVIQAPGNTPFLLNHSTSITFDDNYNLYVADSYNYRIQKFAQLVY